MDRPTTKHNDIDDCDFTDDIVEDEACVCECGEWKNPHRKKCDSCLFTD